MEYKLLPAQNGVVQERFDVQTSTGGVARIPEVPSGETGTIALVTHITALLSGEKMPEMPTQAQMMTALKKIWTAFGGGFE